MSKWRINNCNRENVIKRQIPVSYYISVDVSDTSALQTVDKAGAVKKHSSENKEGSMVQ